MASSSAALFNQHLSMLKQTYSKNLQRRCKESAAEHGMLQWMGQTRSCSQSQHQPWSTPLPGAAQTDAPDSQDLAV